MNGFLLTRSSRDQRGRTRIEYWLSTDDGPTRLVVEGERPVFFIPADCMELAIETLQRLSPQVEIKGLAMKRFEGGEVAAVYSNTISDHFTAQDLLQHRGIALYENDFRLHDRYLVERFIQGGVRFTGSPRRSANYRDFQHCRLAASQYRPRLSMLSLDIECAVDGRLFSVGLAGTGSDTLALVNEVIMIGRSQSVDDIEIHWVDDETSLLRLLVERISQIDPDLLIGWNLINFDMRLLLVRANHCRVPFSIGRDGSVATWRDQRGEKDKGFVSMAGRLAIDGIDALRSATWSFPSFSLENVSQSLLGRGKKVDQDVDDRLAEILHNFTHDKPALARYNLEDCCLVIDVFAHTNIVDYLILRSQITGLELDRTGGSVAAFTNLYLPRLHRAGYIAPNLPLDGGLASPGGYVMDSRPGLYRNVLVFDFKSLYPSIIRTFKIDPMGMIEGLNNPQRGIDGFKGAIFHRDRHFLPEIISSLWQQRDQAKHENDTARSQAIKILMNSFYGVLGSGGCRFYDQRLASSITMRGHEIMQTTRTWIEKEGYSVIYGDTDSTFVALDEAQDAAACRETGMRLAVLINQRWQDLLRRQFDLDCDLELEFETHFSRFLMPTIRGSEAGSKKRYAGLVIDPESRSEQIIFKGLENVRTDWTALAKTFQASLFDAVFHDRDPAELVKRTVDETLAGKRDDQLVYRKQLRRDLDAYVKNVPPHVRAARLADERNAASGRSLRYQNKGAISYVMTLAGPEPVEYRQNPLDYDHYIDRQLKPVADGVLPFIGQEFDGIVSAQTVLF